MQISNSMPAHMPPPANRVNLGTQGAAATKPADATLPGVTPATRPAPGNGVVGTRIDTTA